VPTTWPAPSRPALEERYTALWREQADRVLTAEDHLAADHPGLRLAATDLAWAGQDRQIAAQVHASLNHLAYHASRPQQAIAHARQGQERLGLIGTPTVKAPLLAMEACGHAARRDPRL
jgi:hypothetical protein